MHGAVRQRHGQPWGPDWVASLGRADLSAPRPAGGRRPSRTAPQEPKSTCWGFRYGMMFRRREGESSGEDKLSKDAGSGAGQLGFPLETAQALSDTHVGSERRSQLRFKRTQQPQKPSSEVLGGAHFITDSLGG